MKTVAKIRPAGPDHQVVTVESAGTGFRRTPCGGCPWVKANAINAQAAQVFIESVMELA